MTTSIDQNTKLSSHGFHQELITDNAVAHNWIWDVKFGWRPYSAEIFYAHKVRSILILLVSLFLFILCAFSTSFVWASPNINHESLVSGPYEAELISVHDGDTYRFKVMIWPGTSIEAMVRLRGVDTMELRSKCPADRRLAIAAKEFAHQKLLQSPIRLSQISKGKYFGRVIARVTLTNGEDLGDLLLSHGLALPYQASHRKRGASCPVT